MQTLSRDEVKERLTDGRELALVDVLPPKEFDEFHLPGAVNVPWDGQFDQRIQSAVPDKSTRVVVYCDHVESELAPAAARRMEDLGYQNVCTYEAGKIDWKVAGLPIER